MTNDIIELESEINYFNKNDRELDNLQAVINKIDRLKLTDKKP